MKSKGLTIVVAAVLLAAGLNAQSIRPAEVRAVMKKVADWQLAHMDQCYSSYSQPHHPLDWTSGALYTGLVKWAAMADDDEYYNWLRAVGEQHQWQLHKRTYHADDHAVGQLYAELFRHYGDSTMLAPAIRQFEFIMMHPSLSSLEWATPWHQDRWNWCDALFMSPPVWAKLASITGDRRFLDFMMAEYKATTDFLYDTEEHLYYRDQRYIGQLDHDTKIFWARGNGWVFAGLANIMNELPAESSEFKWFLALYRQMAEKLLAIQTPQGHWAMSLLGQEFYPTPETSGTSFFVYGLAWGINHGYLDRKIYEPAVVKGWQALTSHVTAEGMLGYVQPIGAEPGEAWPDRTELYGSGAFLCAGSEVYRLYGGQ